MTHPTRPGLDDLPVGLGHAMGRSAFTSGALESRVAPPLDRDDTDDPAWIRLVPPEEAEGRLAATYRRVAGPDGQVDRVLQLHGLRPHTLDGHLALYKATLHHSGNELPTWLLELVGTTVSELNGCAYCVAHHGAGLARLVGGELAAALVAAARRPPQVRSIVERHPELTGGAVIGAVAEAALAYARALTLWPASMTREHVQRLRDAGLDDGRILEVNQVVAYFAYVNRAVNGLGVSHLGEALGLAPTNAGDEDDVTHR